GEGRRIVPVLIGELAGVPLGVWLLINLGQRLLSILIGLAVVGFVVYSLRFPDAALPPGRAVAVVGPVVGFISGLMGGTTTFFGPPLTAFFLSLKLEKDVFVFLISLTFEVVNVAQVGLYALSGLFTSQALLVGAGLCLPAWLGFLVGVRIRSRIEPRSFHRLVLAVLTVSGLSLVVRPLLG